MDLGPGEQLVPEMAGEVGVDAGEDGDEVRLEVLDLYLGDVAAVAVRGNELKVASLADEGLHGCGTFIVENVLLGGDAGGLDSCEKGEVRALHFFLRATGHGLDEDGVAVDFDHEHDVFVSGLRRDGEAAGLVGEDGVFGFVHFDVDVPNLRTAEVRRVDLFERLRSRLGRANILAL